MTFKTDDRVFETSITTGTGTYTLDGAQVGFTTFSGMGANNLCPYFATDDTNWEVGIGTVLTGPNRLERTTVLRSSNADAAVNWGAGTRKIRCGLPAAMAIPRTLSKSVAGAADVTLTQDEQRRDILILTGALTGNINVIVDATPWGWIVYNNTSGAYTLTFKTTAGTGIVVAQGTRTHLECDGTNVVSSITGLVSLALSGALAVGGAMNTDSTTDSTSITTGSMQTDGGLGVAKAIFGGTTLDIAGNAALRSIAYIGAGSTLGLGNFSLQVDGTGGGAQLGAAFKVTTQANQVLDLWNSAEAGDNQLVYLRTEGSATTRGTIDYNRAGGAVRYNTTSDATLKTLLGDAPRDVSLDIMRKTRLRQFYWNGDATKRPQIAPFAQELFQVYKGAVSQGCVRDVMDDIKEDVIGDIVEDVFEEMTDAAGNEWRRKAGERTIKGVIGQRIIGQRKVGEYYQPWVTDKTAYVWHTVAGWQDHDERLAAVEAKERRVDALGALLIAQGILTQEQVDSI